MAAIDKESVNAIQPRLGRDTIDFTGIPHGAVLHGVIKNEDGTENMHVAMIAIEKDSRGNDIQVIYDVSGSRDLDDSESINAGKYVRRFVVGENPDEYSSYNYYYEWGMLDIVDYGSN